MTPTQEEELKKRFEEFWNSDKDYEKDFDEIFNFFLSEIKERQQIPIAETCPCHYLPEACTPNCSCVHPYMSGGCENCAGYGSIEQRKSKAKHLASLQDQLTERDKTIEYKDHHLELLGNENRFRLVRETN